MVKMFTSTEMLALIEIHNLPDALRDKKQVITMLQVRIGLKERHSLYPVLQKLKEHELIREYYNKIIVTTTGELLAFALKEALKIRGD
jgi:hypothetical protein